MKELNWYNNAFLSTKNKLHIVLIESFINMDESPTFTETTWHDCLQNKPYILQKQKKEARKVICCGSQRLATLQQHIPLHL